MFDKLTSLPRHCLPYVTSVRQYVPVQLIIVPHAFLMCVVAS